MWRLEARAEPSRAMLLLAPVAALLATVACGALLFALLGKSPGAGLALFFIEPLRGVDGLAELGLKATPLILCGLGLAACYRANVWNIGAEGQFVLGAIAAGGLALHAGDDTTRWVLVPILLAGMLGGMAWASLVALLRDRFNANEILTSLMLVYVAQYLLDWLVYGPWKDPEGYNFPQTALFAASTVLPRLIPGTRLHIGFAVALLAVPAMAIFLRRTLPGFRLLVGGQAPAAARYAGFSARASLWTVLLLSGALSGLAGAFEAVGPLGQLTAQVSQGYGFSAIIVAFVGRLQPVGVVLAALLMAMFYIGGELAQSRLGLPDAMTGVFQGLLLLFLLATDILVTHRLRRRHA
ncbi:branched-chain amino acid transport system / permease component [mine drainage metagenome]|jgi:simple sugar transport system permease protein|uniref:Branched-chain amino acid transport system / permease component n=1 Tax=mine drainage metagenome TaxID=410659 RepID=A0A1J5QSX8_9ZZZZ